MTECIEMVHSNTSHQFKSLAARLFQAPKKRFRTLTKQGVQFLQPSDLPNKYSSNTFMPCSQLIHKSPLVRKQATECLARWWIQPSCLSCVIIASMNG